MRLIALFSCVLLLNCCNPSANIKEGVWRGVIRMQGRELPFNFEVAKENSDYKVWLKNGDEKLLLDEVTMIGDSVNMVLHIFDAELRAKVDGDKLKGFFIRNYATDYRFPFVASFGDDYRFMKTSNEKPAASSDFSGKYDVKFMNEKDTVVSVGIFEQMGNHVTGTFLRNDGDFRYLEGNVNGDTLKLSAFDGNHAFIFIAQKRADTLRGDFYAGKMAHEKWIAVKNDKAVMPDPETLSALKPGFEKIAFSFPDLNKTLVSPSDPKFKDKVVILQVFGTWCPNCMDETNFLAPWYKKNKDRGVEIIGLAYERKDDFGYASDRVKKMKDKLDVNYDFVIAGVNDKEKASSTLPALSKILAFPTTIFIGRDGKVKRIYTGFSGPATGKYYEEYIQHFNELVNELLLADGEKKG